MDANFSTKLATLRMKSNLSLEELGQRVGVSKQSIHRYETNQKKPSTTTLLKLSNVFSVHPSEFFVAKDLTKIEINDINFREGSQIKELEFELEEIKNFCKDYLRRLIELQSLTEDDSKFKNPIKDLKISSRKDVEKAAKKLRTKWKLGNAPIYDVTDTIEGHGLSIIEIEAISKFHGLSGKVNDDFPFILINSSVNDITRRRFTLLHELGHIVLSFAEKLDEDFIEKLCNHFAGAVLLVEDSIASELGRNRTMISLRELRRIKEKYGASIQAIIIRAKWTKVISDNIFNDWWQSYDEWYKTKGESEDFGSYQSREKPYKLEKLIIRGINEQRITWGKAARIKNTKVDLLKRELNELELHVN
ncbi:MAG: XRE family transcriptional regulator [Vicingaceae bacterium]